jgi:hypothetical protein
MMGMTIGNMFLCEACTASVITDNMFAKIFTPTAVSPGDESAIREAMNAANAAGIAERCRAHGLSAAQAKAKARELATLCWNDSQRGGEAIKAFWTSPGTKHAATRRAYDQPQPGIKRRWWEFWKNDSPSEKQKEVSSNERTCKESEVKSFKGKTRKCINCNATFPEGGIQCSVCGSNRFIWE